MFLLKTMTRLNPHLVMCLNLDPLYIQEACEGLYRGRGQIFTVRVDKLVVKSKSELRDVCDHKVNHVVMRQINVFI